MKGIFVKPEKVIARTVTTNLRHYGVWLGETELKPIAYSSPKLHFLVGQHYGETETRIGYFHLSVLDEDGRKVVIFTEYSPYGSINSPEHLVGNGIAGRAELIILKHLLEENPNYFFRHDNIVSFDRRDQVAKRIINGAPIDVMKTYLLADYVRSLEEHLEKEDVAHL